jgi:hypothetical protein
MAATPDTQRGAECARHAHKGLGVTGGWGEAVVAFERERERERKREREKEGGRERERKRGIEHSMYVRD